jgi:hypothetical protein
VGEKEMKLTVTVSKTRNGKQDYLQVMSDDAVSVNVVLVADEVKVNDVRETK